MEEYDPYNVNQEHSHKGEYILMKILKGVFYVLGLVGKIVLEVLKGVLTTFKIPIPKA